MRTKLLKICGIQFKAVLRGKFIALNVYIGKKEKPKISNLNFYFRTLEKEEQIKSKVSRRKDVIKMKAEINELKNRKSVEIINKTKSTFFEKINKIVKTLAKLIKKKSKNRQRPLTVHMHKIKLK